MFQFQTGSIKSTATAEDLTNLPGMFQFQTGSIKSREYGTSLHPIIKFQFQTGSIKSQMIPSCQQQDYVSIPNWFD